MGHYGQKKRNFGYLVMDRIILPLNIMALQSLFILQENLNLIKKDDLIYSYNYLVRVKMFMLYSLLWMLMHLFYDTSMQLDEFSSIDFEHGGRLLQLLCHLKPQEDVIHNCLLIICLFMKPCMDNLVNHYYVGKNAKILVQ